MSKLLLLSFWRLRLLILMSLLAGLSLPVAAAVSLQTLDDSVAFNINGTDYSFRAAAFLAGEARKHNPALDTGHLVKGLIENRLLVLNKAELLPEHHDAEANPVQMQQSETHQDHQHDFGHQGHQDHQDHQGHHDNHAAYTHEIGINVQSQTEYQQLLNSIQRVEPDVDIRRRLKKDIALDEARLQQILPKASGKMSREDLEESQVKALMALPVLGYSFAEKQGVITAWDVFSHANVHHRVRLRRADKETFLKLALEQLLLLVQQQQIIAGTDWTQKDLDDLRLFVRDKVEKQTLFKSLGILADLHHDAAALERFKQQVSDGEIKAYYRQHSDEFLQVASVRARHITLASQEQADKVYQELQSGLSFSDAIKRYSLADDRHAAESGALGLINKNTEGLTFLQKLALIQPVGKASTPYRMLDGKTYEIILVDEKKPEVLPLSDKSVQGSIRTRLAQQKAAAYVEQLQSQLREASQIRINKKHYKGLTLQPW